MEALSLWLCAVCLTHKGRKAEMLALRNTLTRLRVGVASLAGLVHRLTQYIAAQELQLQQQQQQQQQQLQQQLQLQQGNNGGESTEATETPLDESMVI